MTAASCNIVYIHNLNIKYSERKWYAADVTSTLQDIKHTYIRTYVHGTMAIFI